MSSTRKVSARATLVALLGYWCVAGAGAAAGPAPAAAPPPPPPPLEVFGRLPAARLVTLSPNGKLLAMEEERGAARQVTIFESDGGKTRHTVAVEESSTLRNLVWADDETLLLEVSLPHAVYCNPNVLCTYEWFRTLAMRMDGSPPRVLLNDEGARKYVTGSTLLAARTGRPGIVTMSSWDVQVARGRWSSTVFEVDTRTGKEKAIASGTQYTQGWVVDAAGQPVARSEWVADTEQFTIVARQGERWREIFRLKDKEGTELALMGLDVAGKAIIALGPNGTSRSQAWSIPLDGSPVTSLASHPELDVDVALHDRNRHAVVGARTSDNVETYWFDPKLAAQQKSLQNAFKGRNVEVLDRSVVGRRVLVAVEDAAHPPVYQLVDFEKGRADVVAEAYPALDAVALGQVSYIKYLARDGTSIPAYLTLPPGRAATDLPVVVLPHGGPALRDTAAFDWWAQFLATRGYAVLQPQFRGSSGFGEAYRKAGMKQWGGLMQDDVSDGVRHLVATGIADPQRICIVGGSSYGGYAALAGAAFTPELYACAASINGVSDLPSMVGDSRKRYGEGTIDYWEDHVGSPSDPALIAKSPARAASKVVAPVLLLHGVDDTVALIQQSKSMERELKAAGKQVTFVPLPGEDHWLSGSKTRLLVLQELDRFLARYLR